MHPCAPAVAFALSAALAAPGRAQDVRFIPFAQMGQSYSAAVFAGDPDVGRRIVSAEITLHLVVNPGSNAADFALDLLLPVLPDAGDAVVALDGAGLGWSGAGAFDHTETTGRYNGVLMARRYGAETFGVAGRLLEGSGVTLTFESACPADFNGDGFVDFFDYADYVGCFETGACPGGATADFNGDGFVDFFDYADFAAAFESGC